MRVKNLPLKIALVQNRGLLRLSGPDRATFLQGLVAGDVHRITENCSIYTVLLSPQGKFVADLFITQIGDEWLMDCPLDSCAFLEKRLNLYKLRTNITLTNVTADYALFGAWRAQEDETSEDKRGHPFQAFMQADEIPIIVGAKKDFSLGVVYIDPRHIDMGVRLIVPQENVPQIQRSPNFLHIAQDDSIHDYAIHRLRLGIPEAGTDMPVDKAIPLECGLDELHAIDWQKGCYMGQELTARTRYRGLIRKRLIPVHISGVISGENMPVMQGDLVVGEMRSYCQNYGMALLRLNSFMREVSFVCGGATIVPFIPAWMRLPQEEPDV